MRENGELLYTSFGALGAEIQQSLQMARDALELAHPNPYGPPIKVGSVVRTRQGTKYTGASLAVTGQRASLCAEQVALAAAHMGRDRENCIGIVVVLRSEKDLGAPPSPPCGGCLQMINDFAEASGLRDDFQIVTGTHDLASILVTTLGQTWTYRYSYTPTLRQT